MRNPSQAVRSLPLSLLFFCFLSSSASGETSEAMQILDQSIGAPVKLFQEQHRDHVESQYRQALSITSDPLQRDALKRERIERSQELEQTYLEFGGKSEYDKSLLTGEFRHGAGDAMMKARKGEEETFYFFNQGRLWKVLHSMPSHVNTEQIERHLTARFGTAAHLKDAHGKTEIVWESNGRIIALSDRRSDYGCFTLTHADADLYESRRNSMETKVRPELNPMIQAVLSGGGDDSVSDVVDHILDQPSAGTH